MPMEKGDAEFWYVALTPGHLYQPAEEKIGDVDAVIHMNVDFCRIVSANFTQKTAQAVERQICLEES